ncbi:probable xyloglucan galactosyltransferase GT11 [Impatiens glandulifera]|uniref:probable xyloglucan galactosyltransferase GT11 n=1 Tax=Impatiens glandulifera TaxID=253017 RepID=UPI001FB19E06|nr:probable xyloglucan galactosyltransferase GT11 [Impatiens glandulifera]
MTILIPFSIQTSLNSLSLSLKLLKSWRRLSMEKPKPINVSSKIWFACSTFFFIWVLLLCSLSSKTSLITLFPSFSNLKSIFIEENRVDQQFKETDHDESCSGRYIYVHNLPAQFNIDILKNCTALNKWFDMCEPLLNMGLGKETSKQGWYATNQFTLEIIFQNRMNQYDCLTRNSSLATAIYVPYYAGLDVGRYLFGKIDVSVRDKNVVDLVNWLTKQPEWKRVYGIDHFFIGGRVTWDFRRQSDEQSGWGNKLFITPEIRNMTALIIEKNPLDNKLEVAIPYPSYFHPSNSNEIINWQNEVRNVNPEFLFSFVGSPRPNDNTSIRDELINQCLNSIHCRLLDCNDFKCDDPFFVIQAFSKSKFCLQPSGDSYTRRSTFDAILSGCVPVFFHPMSAYGQYVWHLPKNHSSYSVLINETEVKEGKVNIEEVLGKIPEIEVMAMREEVVKLIPKLVYANPMKMPEKGLEDAFEIAVKGVLERIKERKENN